MGTGARLSRMRGRAVGAFELPGRTSAGRQQCRAGHGPCYGSGHQSAQRVTAPRLEWLGRVPYEPTWRAMQQFTESRGSGTDDEIWLLEHEPVFTLGMNADRAHVLDAGDIPLVQ